jgi:Na+/pantothenate symporter
MVGGQARRGTDLGAFYNAHRQAHWVWAGISMIGTAISGLTFLSLPGAVRQDGWTYLQVLLGYLVGYTLVALILLPRYYQLSRASIYEYFRHQLGPQAEKVAAITFLISRLLASSVRLYLALIVLQLFFPQVPFPVLVLLSLMLIYIYAERGGTGTLIYTDLLQMLLFLGAGGLTLLYILTPEVRDTLRLPTIIDLSIESRHYFWKDFLGGVLLSFTMTGLDQDQMQKSLSMPDVTSAQRMIGLYAGLLVPVKLLFLLLGSALWAYVEVNGYPIPARSDQLYASLAQQVFPFWVGAMFVVGLVSSTLSSVDGALVAAQLAIESVANFLESCKEDLTPPALLEQALVEANAIIYKMSQSIPQYRRMGTTCVLAYVPEGEEAVYYAHVGDSRLYWKGTSRFRQMTMDHTYVQFLLMIGAITPEEAAFHPRRHVILRVLGIAPKPEVEVAPQPIPVAPGMCCFYVQMG